MCVVCEGRTSGILIAKGAVAQSVERHAGSVDVVGSIPISSTDFFPNLTLIGYTLGGLVAGEGCFRVGSRKEPFAATGEPRLRFVFSITMALRDRPLIEALRNFLGYGSIHETPPRKSHHQPCATLTVASIKAHKASTIPFADRFLLPSAKRQQFEAWRDAMGEYERNRPTRYGKGPSPCSMPDCEKPVRGRGLCRTHYYRVTGY